MAPRTLKTIEDVINLTGTCTTPEQIRATLAPSLDNLDKNGVGDTPPENIYKSALPGNQDPLATLIQMNLAGGLTFLKIFIARCSSPGADPATMLNYAQHFATHADPNQLRFDFNNAVLFGEWLAWFSRKVSPPVKCMPLLFPYFCRFATLFGQDGKPHFGTLTRLHQVVLYNCLMEADYRTGCQVLEHSIEQFDTRRYQDVLLYHLYGGTIAAAAGYYLPAIGLLETCVCAPSSGQSVSAIQIDAYKRLTLLQLLVHGKLSALPRYTSSALLSSVRSSCGAYTEFACAYEALDKEKLMALEKDKSKIYEEDNNASLITMCLENLPHVQVKKLSEVYLSISLEDVTTHLGMAPDNEGLTTVQTIIYTMIKNREIPATLTKEEGTTPSGLPNMMLNFHEDTRSYDDVNTINHLNNAMRASKEGDYLIDYADKRITMSKDFIGKTLASIRDAGTSQMIEDLDLANVVRQGDWDNMS